jgi:L-iditol 2-dehydrogenase
MKAVMKVARGLGNIELRDIPEPRPGRGEVVIEVKAAGVCGTDLHIYKDEYSSRPPVVLGHELAGVIAEIGPEVDGIRVGARVTSETFYYTCGSCLYCRSGQINLCPQRLSIGSGVNGAFTKYLVVPSRIVHELPANVDFEAGALSEPLACVVNGLFKVPTLSPGDLAVIAGPGSVGLIALQVARAAGARTVVLGTGGDAARLALAKSLGADFVVNVEAEDPRRLIAELSTEGLGADVVIECSGAARAASTLLDLVRKAGRYVQIGVLGKPITWDLDQLVMKELRAVGSFSHMPWAWPKALELLRSGVVKTKPLATTVLPLTEWRKGFEGFDTRQGIKTLLTPVD